MSNEHKIEHVDAVDPTKKTSAIDDAPAPEIEGEVKAGPMCWYNGREFGTGAIICSGGARLACAVNGIWYNTGRC